LQHIANRYLCLGDEEGSRGRGDIVAVNAIRAGAIRAGAIRASAIRAGAIRAGTIHTVGAIRACKTLPNSNYLRCVATQKRPQM
jgi:hypothetical protein